MKKPPLLLGLIMLCITSFAQKMPQDYFDEGTAFVDTEEYGRSITSFKYITDNYPKDELCPLSLYNLAYLYAVTEDYGNAIPTYEKILASNLNEHDLIGGNIMDNPYALYKHKACKDLCGIYSQQQDYTKALHYLELSDTTYPYLHFCGNEIAEYQVAMALEYAKIYEKLGRKEDCIRKLIPLAFWEEEKIDAVLAPLLSGRKGLKTELELALNNIYFKQEYPYKTYYITFLGGEIYMGHDANQPFDKNKAAEELRESSFYKIIEKL